MDSKVCCSDASGREWGLNAASLKWLLLDLAGHLVLIMIVTHAIVDCVVFVPILFLIVAPIFGYGSKEFQRCSTLFTFFLTPIVITPFTSWSGFRIMFRDYEMWKRAKRKNTVVFVNHSTRVDWIVAGIVGFHFGFGEGEPQAIVNFVVEKFQSWLPGLGWHLNWVGGNMFLQRSFKHDAATIRRQIRAYENNPLGTMILIGTEGFIVDSNSPMSQMYLENCREFCKAKGFEPFKYLLTPRYKGLSILGEHVEKGKGFAIDGTMAWTRGHTNPKMLSVELTSPERAVPDLYAIVTGMWGRENRITCWCDARVVDIPDDPAKLRQMMMEAWSRKDKLLETFHKTGKYAPDQEGWVELPPQHLLLNVMVILHHVWVYGVCYYTGTLWLLWNLTALCLFTFLVLNPLGMWIVGYSIESIPFETSTKPFLLLALRMAEFFSSGKKTSTKVSG